MKKIMWALGVVLALFVIGCGLGGNDDGPVNAEPANATEASDGPTPVKTKDGTIGDGTWVVGKHVKAGTYRSSGAADSVVPYCNWSAKSGEEIEDLDATDKKADPQQVTLKKGMTFETSGCAVWVKEGS